MVKKHVKRAVQVYARRGRPTKSERVVKTQPHIRKAGESPPRYRLKDLLKGISKKNRHPEIDFGPPVGREVL